MTPRGGSMLPWLALATLALGAAACRGDAAVTNCGANLGGTYADTEGGRYFVVDDGARVAIYEASREGARRQPVTSPPWFELYRRPSMTSGVRQFRRTIGRTSCEVRAPAELTSCAGALVIRHGVASPPGDRCTFTVPSSTELTLRRRRAYRL